MRRPPLATLCLAALAAAPATRPITRLAEPVTLEEVRERGLAGRLGPRLGTVLTVAGVVVENRSRAKADEGEPFFLRIDAVDGRPLATPVLYAASAMDVARDAPGLKVGDRFRCAGFETGDFRGAADGEFRYVESYADQSFHFAPRFAVLKVLPPA